MRGLVLLLFLVGISAIISGYVKSKQQCPPPRVEFRYIPKTFEDEQKNPLPLSATFGTMFRGRDAWAHNNDLSSILDAEKKDRLFNH